MFCCFTLIDLCHVDEKVNLFWEKKGCENNSF